MRRLHEKSIFLGIGIGMIITALVGMIFYAGTKKELSKAEIISLAKGYGLIEQTKILNRENSSNSSTEAAMDSTVDDSVSDQKSTEKNIIIEIKDGYKSQHVIDSLLENGVITSEKDFTAVLNSYNASTKINAGTFKFRKNEDLHYIVKTICNIK